MNVTFRQLQLFLALADHGSISAAAKACHVTQPTVSMQLKELADSVGQPLYEVIGKKVFLTEAGKQLRDTARQIRQTWDEFGQQMDQLQGVQRGKLRVAVVSTAKYFVPALLGAFCKAYPGVDISLSVLNRDGVLGRLEQNEDDLYIMSQPPQSADIVSEVFLANPLVLIAPLDHPIATQAPTGLPALAQSHFILREPGSGTRRAVDRHFAALDFEPRIRMELGSNEAIKHSVAAGLGLAILSRHSLHADPRLDGLAIVALPQFPIEANWHIVHHRNKRLAPVAEAFLLHLREYVAGLPSAINPPDKG